MPLTLPSLYYLEQEKDVFHLVLVTKQLAQSMGFSVQDSNLVALAVSEIATNVIRYANRGSALICRTKNFRGIDILIEDIGDGIANLELSMCDGVSSRKNSLGLGFGAAQRALDELIINKSDMTGTSITLIKYLPQSVEELDIGQVSFPAVGEAVNKDTLLIKTYEGDKTLAAIFDYGRGCDDCARSIGTLKDLLLTQYKKNLEEIAALFYQELKHNICRTNLRCSILKLGPAFIEVLGIDGLGVYADTSSGDLIKGLSSLDEDLEDRIVVTRLHTPDEYLFILYSDGVKGDKLEVSYRSDFSAQSIAMTVFDAHALSQDDASVIVIKGKKNNAAT